MRTRKVGVRWQSEAATPLFHAVGPQLSSPVPGKRCRAPLATALHIFLACLLSAGAFAQPTLSGRVSGGFKAPSSTDAEGRRHVIKGSSMEPRGKDLLELTQPRVTRYNADDSEDMFMESAKCFYQTKQGMAYSPTNLAVRTADGRFSIEGVGWNWDLSGSLLTISNEVVAVVQKSALATNKMRGATNFVRITSKRFQQEGDAAKFLDSVLVRDGEDTLRCERLNIQFVKPGGAQKIEAFQNVEVDQGETHVRSGQASYDVKENIIRISEHPTWIVNQREGSADSLIIRRAEDTFSAMGNVYMKLPATNLVLDAGSTSQAATNRSVEIRSHDFDYQNARSNRLATAVYSGRVRVSQANALLTCEQLTANFGASNRLSHLLAERDVQMTSDKTKLSGREADYDLDSDKLVLKGDPRWHLDETIGKSDLLVFSPRTGAMEASQNVEVIVPGHTLGAVFSFPGQTNEIPETNSPLKITSQNLIRSTNLTVFEKNVLVADARGTIECGILTIAAGETNQTQTILAEQHVVIKQPNLTGFGERAEYDAGTGLVRLTGDPELLAPDKKLKADAFVIDRNRNTFSVSPGHYRIQLRLSKNPK
jgi:lipopolysaccharide export system protein LptA